MKVLIATTHHPVCSGRWMTDAFKRIGVDVRHFGWESEWPHIDERHYWKPDADYSNGYWSDWTPDLVLYMDTAYKPWTSQYTNVPHAVYCTCNAVCNMTMPTMQHYFVAAKYGPEWPVAGDDMTWLPNAYDPTLHTPSQIPYDEREYDVCMVGTIGPPRRAIITAMEDAGLKVFADVHLYYEDYVAAYHNSRIGLVYNEQQSGMMRIFETAAMGCVVLSNPILDYEDLRPRGVEVFRQEDASNAATMKAEMLIDNPDYARRLISNAQVWVRPHTWDARAQAVVTWWTENREQLRTGHATT